MNDEQLFKLSQQLIKLRDGIGQFKEMFNGHSDITKHLQCAEIDLIVAVGNIKKINNKEEHIIKKEEKVST